MRYIYLTKFKIDANNIFMKVNDKEYITIPEMAGKLNIPPNTVKQRLFQHGIRPVSKDALYELSALGVIKETSIGRPKKTEPVTKVTAKAKPAKKTKGKK